MMKVNSNAPPIKFHGEDGEVLSIRPSNMGEPYRDGMEFTFESDHNFLAGFLERYEIKELHKTLGEYLNIQDN